MAKNVDMALTEHNAIRLSVYNTPSVAVHTSNPQTWKEKKPCHEFEKKSWLHELQTKLGDKSLTHKNKKIVDSSKISI